MTYFDFLIQKISPNQTQARRYSVLLKLLFNEPFSYSYDMDANRYDDGLALRNNYIYHMKDEYGLSNEDLDELDRWVQSIKCSWLEAMVALAIKCEDIMSEPEINHTSKWFWGMIDSMGLSDQIDEKIDIGYVSETLMKIYHHDYSPDGYGGMFYVPGTNIDMRHEEIWTQAMGYLNQFD